MHASEILALLLLQTNSTTFNFLVDYDDAKAIGIYGTNNFIGCQNLRPPFPDFPK